MRRPNILFILADDLGWNDLGAGGSVYYESPHIDRIAHEGMRFTRGYAACQVCSPSRASILTGLVTPRHGITDWIGAPAGEAWRKLGRHNRLLPPEYAHRLPAGAVTFAEAFRRAGYRTFFAGKWHLGGTGSAPEDYGFEINRGGWEAGSPVGGYFSPWENPKLPPGPAGESLPIRLARETAAFIRANAHRPFLAYLSFYSVHAPLQTRKELWDYFRRKAVRRGAPARRFAFDRVLPVRQVQDNPVYAGMIRSMDDAVGIVLDALDERGLTDNTVVCFTSDNGGVSSGDAYASSMLPLRGGKGRQWEGGIREPYWIRFPGRIPADTVCDVPVSGIDFFPTLLELAGVPMPSGTRCDGRSIVPLLEGKPPQDLAERDLFWHYPHYGNQGGEPSSIIRHGPWKLIHYYEDGRDELYHLEDDPGEQRDVVSSHPKTAGELRRRLERWLAETGAKRPVPDPEYDPGAEADRLAEARTVLMEKLEAEHAACLEPDWEPNPDWWGSRTTPD